MLLPAAQLAALAAVQRSATTPRTMSEHSCGDAPRADLLTDTPCSLYA